MKSPGATARRALAAEPVARFADRPDDVPGDRRRRAGAHSTMRIQAPYIAGRIRSFIAASTMQKLRSTPGLR
jgi:hypothetical protein